MTLDFTSQSYLGNDGNFAAILSRFTQLATLHVKLRGNVERKGVGDAVANDLATALPELPQLSALHLCCWNTQVGDAWAKELAAAFARLQQLSFLRLELWSSHVGDAGVKELAIALPCFPQLSFLHLDLWNSHVGDAGAKDHH